MKQIWILIQMCFKHAFMPWGCGSQAVGGAPFWGMESLQGGMKVQGKCEQRIGIKSGK